MENKVVNKIVGNEKIEDREIGVKKPFVISLSALLTIVLFSSMLLFVLLLMFVETANMIL